MANDKTDKPLGALFSELTTETMDLVRKEISLAKAEMSEKISTAQTGLTSMAIGGAVILSGLIVVLIAIANAVAMVLPPELAPWLAPLLVGGIVMIIGFMMLKGGSSKLKSDNLKPHRTIHSLNRDKAVAQGGIR